MSTGIGTGKHKPNPELFESRIRVLSSLKIRIWIKGKKFRIYNTDWYRYRYTKETI
jgi:hypothetical protein